MAWLICLARPVEAAGGAWIDGGFIQNGYVYRFYAFPGPVYFAITQNGRVHRSTDARNWTTVFQFPKYGSMGNSAMLADGSSLLMGYDHPPDLAPLVQSLDGGATWKPTGISNASFLSRLSGGGVLAWTPDGFYRAEGPQYPWRQVPARWNGADAPPYRIFSFEGQERNGRIIALPVVQLAPATPNYRREVWIAPTGGPDDTLHWTRIGDSVPIITILRDTTLLSVSAKQLFQSDDYGLSWHLHNEQGPDFIHASGEILVGQYEREPLRSAYSRDGGATWQGVTALDGRRTADLLLRGDTVFAAAGIDAVLEARPGEPGLRPAGRGILWLPPLNFIRHDGALIGYNSFKMARLADGSAEWTDFKSDRTPYLSTLASSGSRLYGCGDILLRHDAGKPLSSWDSLGTSACRAVAEGAGRAGAVRVIPSGINDSRIYLTFLGADGTVRDVDLGLRSEIGPFRALAVQGDTLVAAFTRLHVATLGGPSVAVKAPMDTTVGVVFHGRELYRTRLDGSRCRRFCLDRSADLGETWTPCGGTAPASHTLRLASSRLGLIAATDSGVFVSPDRGFSWHLLGDWEAGVMAHAIRVDGDQVAVGHDDGGVRFLDLATVHIIPRPGKSSLPHTLRSRSGVRYQYRGAWILANGRAASTRIDAP